MNLPQLKRTICMDLRRAVRILPATLLYTLLFLLVSLVVIKNGESLFFDPNRYTKVPVGLFMPLNSDQDKSGLKLVEDMQSFREALEIHQFDTEEEGRKALEAAEITALIMIPEGFVGNVSVGNNQPIRIIFQENNTLEEHIINDLLLSSANMLGTAQAAKFAVQSLNEVFGASISDKDAAFMLADNLDSYNLAYVLARESLFVTKSFDSLSGLSLKEKLAGSYGLLVLSFLCFILTAFYQGKKPAYVIRQKCSGVSRFGIGISEWISTVVLLYAAFLLIFLGFTIAKLSPKLTALITIFPVLMVLGLFILLLSYAVRNPVYSNLVILVAIVLLMYIAGGLIPEDFLPKFLQDIARWNPVSVMIRFMRFVLFKGV